MKLGVPVVFSGFIDPAVVPSVVFPRCFGDLHGEAMGKGPLVILRAVTFVVLGAFLSAGFAEILLMVHHLVVEFVTGGALVTAAEVALFWGEAGDTSPFDDEDVTLVETEISVDDH